MYIVTPALRTAFIHGLRPAYARLLPTKLIANRADIVFGATNLYLSGAPFNNRGANRQIHMMTLVNVERTLNPLCEEIYRYFNVTPAPTCQTSFNTIHESLCDLFLSSFRAEGYIHTYGNAQKFVNILFKYLACYNDSVRFEKWFKYCHMALDGYTYNEYRLPFYQYIVYPFIYGIRAPHLTSWTQLTKPEYLRISSDIQTYVREHPKTYNEYVNICARFPILPTVHLLSAEDDYVLTPFESEFFLWPIAKSCYEKDNNRASIYSRAFVNAIKRSL